MKDLPSDSPDAPTSPAAEQARVLRTQAEQVLEQAIASLSHAEAVFSRAWDAEPHGRGATQHAQTMNH